MITEWRYNNIGNARPIVKEIIATNNYTAVDIGGSMDCWAYPECSTFVDVQLPRLNEPYTLHKLNLESESDREVMLEYVRENGKFDFSICSHFLEDIFNPVDLIKYLPLISKKGFIASPSKYNEFTKLYGSNYRGNAHHKHILDVTDDTLILYPKFSFIEVDERSEEVLKDYKGSEIVLFWEETIPYRIFGDGIPFQSDWELVERFYEKLLK